MSVPDLSTSIRDVILASSLVTSKLTAYKGSYPVFTRRPVPDDAPNYKIVISPDIAESNIADGLSDLRPLITRDVSVYGSNELSSHYRDVESIAYAIRTLFHRQRNIIVSGWRTVIVNATGPLVAPVDDDDTVGRIVSLSIQLAKLGI